MQELELRLYGLVPYQLIGIQKGIQYGHANDEMTLRVIKTLRGKDNMPTEEMDKYIDWLEFWKTYIILNGGTTNTNPIRLGTMNKHLSLLRENGVFCSEFYEPDLGDQLTAITFVVDERVFNKEKYPDLKWMNDPEWGNTFPPDNPIDSKYLSGYDEWTDWIVNIGGKKNLFLRNFLKNFKLA